MLRQCDAALVPLVEAVAAQMTAEYEATATPETDASARAVVPATRSNLRSGLLNARLLGHVRHAMNVCRKTGVTGAAMVMTAQIKDAGQPLRLLHNQHHSQDHQGQRENGQPDC